MTRNLPELLLVPPLSLTMLYNCCLHSAALSILLTSTIALALYTPRSKIMTTTTTTTTSETAFVWADQNQQFNPFNEDIATISFTCFKCPMNPKLLREIRLFTPAGERGAPSNDPQPQALICEYDMNESSCRYDPVSGTLLSLAFSLTVPHPTGHRHASRRPTIWGFLRSFNRFIS